MTILDSTESGALRCDYIRNFVNTASSYYKKNIERKEMFSDGRCYTGYLWDCLLNPSIISEYEADQLLQEKRRVFIMWDIHSCERILIPEYWKFPKSRVLYADAWLESFKDDLPEDLYLFDDTLSWSVIYTHETDVEGNRYCLFIDRCCGNALGKSAFE